MLYEVRGSGEPLVLIHGIGSRWQVWEPVLDLLARDFQVWAVDLPGFGASTPGPGATTVPDLIEHVRGFLDAQGLDRPHLAGNSMGGGISLELARRGVARSVTAFSPIGFWNTPERVWTQAALLAARMLARYGRPVVPLVASNRITRAGLFGLFYGQPGALSMPTIEGDLAGLGGADGFNQALRSFSEFRWLAGDVSPEVPVTIAWGSRDLLLPYWTQHRRAEALLPFAAHVTLPGCGHLPMHDNPELCAEVVTRTAQGAVIGNER